ncbi:hypothetical protein PoB_002987700 [Plakobranchus ocellatus]|uniref:Uncharacterized protein n=1 Tax=Plakobranchus ocellatus TaxID=259542 RepID=A0AAV4A900_9GAST|nr:hypothetical protein PoB_002987700 [Plakobranchus ocellatus]
MFSQFDSRAAEMHQKQQQQQQQQQQQLAKGNLRSEERRIRTSVCRLILQWVGHHKRYALSWHSDVVLQEMKCDEPDNQPFGQKLRRTWSVWTVTAYSASVHLPQMSLVEMCTKYN